MENARPEPGAELNFGAETVPRAAATVILLRGAEAGLEVLLAQRNPQARFMGGAWVFPGGAVSAEDGSGQDGLRAAAVRELHEEVGITLDDPRSLTPFSRWITPAEVKKRFDTWFFLATAPAGAEPRVDGAEMIDARWYTPSGALDAAAAGEILLVFPTIKHLEQISGFASSEALLAHARTRTVRPVQPRVVSGGEMARIVLPGEPGYDD